MKSIKFEITTKSNLFIGGMPTTFEIGGVDLSTITDYKGNPFIPASSLKGSLRRIAIDLEKDGNHLASEIADEYGEYLLALQNENKEQMEKRKGKIEEERLIKLQDNFLNAIENITVGYLFGIKGFNDVPKLIFNDVKLKTEENDWYSIDSKTSIEIGAEVKSNPRTYKTVRPEVTFSGEILFYKMTDISENSVEEFVKTILLEFNHGIYCLGNSGSRGYGKIYIEIVT